jgi:hypothetical protein
MILQAQSDDGDTTDSKNNDSIGNDGDTSNDGSDDQFSNKAFD